MIAEALYSRGIVFFLFFFFFLAEGNYKVLNVKNHAIYCNSRIVFRFPVQLFTNGKEFPVAKHSCTAHR